jgi:hypothetical protein
VQQKPLQRRTKNRSSSVKTSFDLCYRLEVLTEGWRTIFSPSLRDEEHPGGMRSVPVMENMRGRKRGKPTEVSLFPGGVTPLVY